MLFLDEPTAGLDPQSRIALWEILDEPAPPNGQTILLTTHYMEGEAQASCCASGLAIIDHGKVLALDTPEKLKQLGHGMDTMVTVTADGDLERLAQGAAR